MQSLSRLLFNAATAMLMLSYLIFQSAHVDAKPQTLVVTSQLLSEPATFNVTLPPSYHAKKDKRYVVLFDLHPRSHKMLAGMHDWMSHNGDWPWLETIIVTAPDGHESLGKLKAAAIEQQGEQQLLDFFEQDLLPTIDKAYRTNGFRVFNGFTGNAGLVIYALVNRPQLFNAYIASSPVLSKDFAFVLNDLPKQLPKMTLPRFLLVSTSDSGYEQRQLASFAQLESLLQQHAPQALNYKVQRFDGSYYMTQPVLSTAHGIEMIFDPVHQKITADSEVGKQGAKAVLAHYQHLSENIYGFEVSAVASLSSLAETQFQEQPQQAIETLTLAVNTYPKDPHAHAALGETYLKMEKRSLAKTSIQTAMSLTSHPFWLNRWGKWLQQAEQTSL
ncbi:alpha/beta hydrolase-fold protein [Shewanella maritima]|uniref:alpha/beta hydrolase-fold protein n=1 Tax=Shewanella maritima TaxID=2520507 RepID=UPI0037355887